MEFTSYLLTLILGSYNEITFGYSGLSAVNCRCTGTCLNLVTGRLTRKIYSKCPISMTCCQRRIAVWCEISTTMLVSLDAIVTRSLREKRVACFASFCHWNSRDCYLGRVHSLSPPGTIGNFAETGNPERSALNNINAI